MPQWLRWRRVWFINVGAYCTLVMDVATGRSLLVDCPSGYVEHVKQLLSQAGATLDTVIVTHWDLDHYGGASRLAVGLPVRRILYNHDTLFPDSEISRNMRRSALKHFLNVRSPSKVWLR